MKYYLVCDNDDTLAGMRLAGIEGELAHNAAEVRAAIDGAVTRGDVGILLITEKCAALCPDLVNDIKLNLAAPLLVEIPARDGTGRAPDSITRYIREGVGIKL